MNLQKFWKDRHRHTPGIQAVANRSFSPEKNEADYARCQDLILRMLKKDVSCPEDSAALDLGFGSGHYARVAERAGIGAYEGLDFAAPPISGMGPTYLFRQLDVAKKGLDLGRKFDAVFVFDVAFHIVESGAFDELMQNIKRHASGVIYLTGLFHEFPVSNYVYHRELRNFSCLGRVRDIRPWRDVLLARIDVE